MKTIFTILTIAMAISLSSSLFAAECPGKENRSGIACPGEKD
jgi:hypothetical protein